MPDNRNHLITYVGAVMVMIGAFAPLAVLPVVGSFSYADMTGAELYLMLLLAAAGPGLILLKKEIFVPASGVGVWLVLLWPVISNMGGGGDDGGLLSRVTDAAADPMQKFASEIFSRLDVLSWGGAVFLLGALVLLVGSIMTFLEAKKG